MRKALNEVHKSKGRVFATIDGLETKLTNRERKRRSAKRAMAKYSRRKNRA